MKFLPIFMHSEQFLPRTVHCLSRRSHYHCEWPYSSVDEGEELQESFVSEIIVKSSEGVSCNSKACGSL